MKKMLFSTLLLLYPLRVSLVEKNRMTRVLFARTAATAASSPGVEVVQEIEGNIAAAEGR